jgi:hypothetical protein
VIDDAGKVGVLEIDPHCKQVAADPIFGFGEMAVIGLRAVHIPVA